MLAYDFFGPNFRKEVKNEKNIKIYFLSSEACTLGDDYITHPILDRI